MIRKIDTFSFSLTVPIRLKKSHRNFIFLMELGLVDYLNLDAFRSEFQTSSEHEPSFLSEIRDSTSSHSARSSYDCIRFNESMDNQPITFTFSPFSLEKDAQISEVKSSGSFFEDTPIEYYKSYDSEKDFFVLDMF